MECHTMDLEASRCPMAMSYVRRAVDDAVAGGFKGEVSIVTIEPSMVRDLPLYLASVENVEISSVKDSKLPQDLIEEWLASGEATEEELLDIDKQSVFTIKFD